jgi:hypothetical protein
LPSEKRQVRESGAGLILWLYKLYFTSVPFRASGKMQSGSTPLEPVRRVRHPYSFIGALNEP